VAARLVKRLLRAPLVLFLLITISFFLMRLAPGGPFSRERALSEEAQAALEAMFGLDQPLHIQYEQYLASLLRGDLGRSMKHKDRTVNEIIAYGLPKSVLLGSVALVLALAIGCFAGILSALKPNSWPDTLAMGVAILGISLPAFVIGPLLQVYAAPLLHRLCAALGLEWRIAIAGWESKGLAACLILPAVTLALPFAARIARLTRAGMLEVMSQDFIRVARAKGLRERTVVVRHALRGGLLPVVSYLGPAIAMIMTGSLVVEKIFQIPGMGREFVEGALNRDYTLVLATVIVYGVLIIACNLIVDIAYTLLDPRVRDA